MSISSLGVKEWFDSLTTTKKYKIMKVLKYNQSGRIVFLVIKWNQIVFKSRNEKECYEYVFNSM
jgi:hypothetical protein